MEEIAIPNSNFLSASHPDSHYEGKVQILPSLDVIDLMLHGSGAHHVNLVGMTGGGKNITEADLIGHAHKKKMKIVCIHNPGPSVEHGFLKFPAEGEYAKILLSQGIKPEGYNVKVYFPICKGFMPKEIPDFFEPYTVPLGGMYPTIDAELLSIIPMVGLTPIGIEAMNHILRDFKPEDNLANFYYEIGRLMDEGYEELNLYFKVVGKKTENPFHRVLLPLLMYRMMSHASFEYALTNEKFTKILNNQDEISVFSVAWMPKNLRHFGTLLPLQYVFNNFSGCEHPILLVGNEIHNIMQNTFYEKSYPAYELMSKWLVELVTSGRKYNIHFMGDTQILGAINPNFVSQAMLLAFYTDLKDDRDLAAYVRKTRTKEGAKDMINILHSLTVDPEHGLFEYYVPSMERTFYAQLPLTATPYEGNKSDFMRYVEKHYPDKEKWFPTENLHLEIEDAIMETARHPIIADYIRRKRDVVAQELDKLAKSETQSEKLHALRNSRVIGSLSAS